MQMVAVVYFPNIQLDKLNDFREKYDPSWKIIPPHITIVPPVSEISEKQLIEHVKSSLRDVKSFPILLNGLVKSFDHYLFLSVKEGNEAIVDLHDRLYSGILKPYIPTEFPFAPHVTLGYFGNETNGFDKELYEKAYQEAARMNINVTFQFDNITLIKGDGITPAKVIKRFTLH